MTENVAVRKARARVFILEAHKTWQVQTGRLGWGSFKAFTEAYNTAEVIVPVWVRAEYESIGRNLLGRWWKAYDAHGPEGLLLRYGNRKGEGLLENDPELCDAILALRQKSPRMTSTDILARLAAAFPGRKLPSQRSLQRFLATC